MRRTFIGLTLLLASAACGSEQSDPAPGSLVLTFSITEGARNSSSLVDAPVGTVYGNLFLTRNVSVTGPQEGAEQFGEVEVSGVDLTSDEVSVAAWTSDPLPPDDYTFLGFFDVDANAVAPGLEPDSGDPVTLPTTNQMTVTGGEDLDAVVYFDLVL